MTPSTKARNQILGTLVDRAVGMPAQKPRDIGTRLERAEYIDYVTDASNHLDRSLRKNGYDELRARSLIDSGGPFWSKVLDEYLELSRDEQLYILDRLTPLATRAAEELMERADERGWRRIVSQYVLLDFMTADGDTRRPDLMCWNNREIAVIDVKTVNDLTAAIRGHKSLRGEYAENENQVRKYVQDLDFAYLKGREVSACLLYLDHKDSSEWRPVKHTPLACAD